MAKQVDSELRPAQKLLGLTLPEGYFVESHVDSRDGASGSHASECYIVRSASGDRAFLKAFDFLKAFNSLDPLFVLQSQSTAFLFERDILEACLRLDKVVTAKGHGTVTVDETRLGQVPYLIFELGEGDVRSRLSELGSVDLAWNLRCLHHIAVGLMELHSRDIAHQDVKPSNILVFADKSKVGDLGRASRLGQQGPWDDLVIPGDSSYAPPELRYDFSSSDWKVRRYGHDLYLLGSMVVFFFTQLSMTTMILKNLAPPFHPENWKDTYARVKPYVYNAFTAALDEFGSHVSDPKLRTELVEMLRQVCHPDPDLRGVPSKNMGMGPSLSLERYVSQLDRIACRAEQKILR